MNPLQSTWTTEDIAELGAVKLDDLKTILLKMYNQYHLPDNIQFIVGTTPGAPSAGSNTYTNTDLAGKRYRVQRNGVGILIVAPLTGYQYTQDPSGGFTLSGSDIFSSGEQFTIEYY